MQRNNEFQHWTKHFLFIHYFLLMEMCIEILTFIIKFRNFCFFDVAVQAKLGISCFVLIWCYSSVPLLPVNICCRDSDFFTASALVSTGQLQEFRLLLAQLELIQPCEMLKVFSGAGSSTLRLGSIRDQRLDILLSN